MIETFDILRQDPYWKFTLIGMLIGAIAIVMIILELLFGKRRKRKIMFKNFRKVVREGYLGIQTAANSLKTLDDAFKEIGENAKR